VVKCLPPGNRAPTKDEVLNCDKFLLREIEVIKPLVIITFGQTASRFILRHFDCEPEVRRHSLVTALHRDYAEPIYIRKGDEQVIWRPFMHPRWSFKFLGSAVRFEGSVSQGIRLAIEGQQLGDQPDRY
jgi:uracil-DNA glycosylase